MQVQNHLENILNVKKSLSVLTAFLLKMSLNINVQKTDFQTPSRVEKIMITN